VEVGYGKSAKSILCAIIDDHSRVIVGSAFSTKETVSALTVVLKEAFETHGLPMRLYVDNGAAFSSELLHLACARSGISLCHSKPYDSPSRGKIERFFRTVRDRLREKSTKSPPHTSGNGWKSVIQWMRRTSCFCMTTAQKQRG
jgi:transposase InsO family protein